MPHPPQREQWPQEHNLNMFSIVLDVTDAALVSHSSTTVLLATN
jgi:hypothetical protein